MSAVDVVRGRPQSFTNKQLLTRPKTKKMAHPTGLAAAKPPACRRTKALGGSIRPD
jgi:hypothetical protein